MALSTKKYKIFHFVIMAYLLAAFAWWAILLHKKTDEIHRLKISLDKQEQVSNLAEINSQHDSQKKMIYGEGLFFGLSILFGLVFMYKGFWSEIEVNKKLSNFLLSVTHELKTPIASLNLINRTLATKEVPDTKRQELLNLSYDESLRLESLVDNILTAAKIDSRYDFNFEPTALAELVEKRIDRFQKHITP